MKQTMQPLSNYEKLSEDEMEARSFGFYEMMKHRRTVRNFSDQPVDKRIIKNCLRAASTAPSGANQQPWQFVVVSDPSVKEQIRKAAEHVETEFYTQESTKNWVKELEHLGTIPEKPFLEKAPFLIVIFSQLHGYDVSGEKKKHYYVSESVGIATGMLITGLHHAGLTTLTYTPAKMRFLNRILHRPKNEKPFMILVTGYPSEKALVPVIRKKPFEDITQFI